MEVDQTTLADLSVFHHDESQSIFRKFNLTRTTGGQEYLSRLFSHTLNSLQEIQDTQNILKLILKKQSEWPSGISNGSIMMIYKFYETTLSLIPANPTTLSAFTYKLLNGPDYGLVKYSAGHAFEFLRGMKKMIRLFSENKNPAPLQKLLETATSIMDKPQFELVDKVESFKEIPIAEMLSFASFIRYRFKQSFYDLISLYYHLDAWYGMAQSVEKFNLVFPEFLPGEEPVLQISGLYHPLIPQPVPYNVILNDKKNFIFLTGANMAGKSTFIKAVGSAVFMAHIGMGVPAKSMKVTLFDGLLSNINVQDNIINGESYFYNEVIRIKNTVLKVTDKRKWLVLIDELFKGTNIQDAMKCSTVVIRGLIKVKKSLFILSTHLYEISEDLKEFGNIDFKYFQAGIEDGQLKFNYQLLDGVSNDRLGYFILKSEKVTNLLDEIP